MLEIRGLPIMVCVCKHAGARGSGGMLSQNKLGALKSFLRPHLYPNSTSLARIPGGYNTPIHYNVCQSSRGVSVTVVNPVHVEPLASFPGAQKIGGNAWYTLFAHARLPRFFWGTWKLP